eukprot:TRINITY_DN71252_c0_g1_i1.p1 TRINITY_DN71252_c0_g1~~TRINITY_DN71252_c0_g1_i1.p1  ORF type:complete len:411 (-),score=48.09 TRINITY_DN71252_c0_g1_i1:225-1421(-)
MAPSASAAEPAMASAAEPATASAAEQAKVFGDRVNSLMKGKGAWLFLWDAADIVIFCAWTALYYPHVKEVDQASFLLISSGCVAFGVILLSKGIIEVSVNSCTQHFKRGLSGFCCACTFLLVTGSLAVLCHRIYFSVLWPYMMRRCWLGHWVDAEKHGVEVMQNFTSSVTGRNVSHLMFRGAKSFLNVHPWGALANMTSINVDNLVLADEMWCEEHAGLHFLTYISMTLLFFIIIACCVCGCTVAGVSIGDSMFAGSTGVDPKRAHRAMAKHIFLEIVFDLVQIGVQGWTEDQLQLKEAHFEYKLAFDFLNISSTIIDLIFLKGPMFVLKLADQTSITAALREELLVYEILDGEDSVEAGLQANEGKVETDHKNEETGNSADGDQSTDAGTHRDKSNP